MANYYGTSRSNYFKVKDTEKFRELCAVLDVEMIERDDLVGFICSHSEDGSLPSCIYNEKVGEHEDINVCQMIAPHLRKGQVAVMVEAGAEKHRYVTGFAVAVNWEGEEECVSIDQIYNLAAKKFGVKKVTKAEY